MNLWVWPWRWRTASSLFCYFCMSVAAGAWVGPDHWLIWVYRKGLWSCFYVWRRFSFWFGSWGNSFPFGIFQIWPLFSACLMALPQAPDTKNQSSLSCRIPNPISLTDLCFFRYLLAASITLRCHRHPPSRSKRLLWRGGWTLRGMTRCGVRGWVMRMRKEAFFWVILGPKEREVFCRCSKTREGGLALRSALSGVYEVSIFKVELHGGRQLTLHSPFLWTIITVIRNKEQTLPYLTTLTLKTLKNIFSYLYSPFFFPFLVYGNKW